MSGSAPPRPWPGPVPGPPAGDPDVVVFDEQSAVAVDSATLAELARAVLVERGVAGGELSLSFVDEQTMAELNGRYLDGDGPTDVLAFPLDAGADSTGAISADGPAPVLLGDVVVCPVVAERQADDRSMSAADELALLVVHGVLHVLGLDHAEADEAAVMQAAERDLLARFHRPVPPT